MKKLLQFLFGCQHANYGFPMTRIVGGVKLTVRVCTDCGSEKKYDWARMRFVPFERGEERQLRGTNYGAGVIR